MRKKKSSIPVNSMISESGAGISFERLTIVDEQSFKTSTETNDSHRHDGHSFFLLEKGSVQLDIDFRKYKIKAPSLLYVHPDQVHRTFAYKKIMVSSWAISNENLNPAYRTLLEDLVPAKPLRLDKTKFDLISQTVALCLTFFQQTENKLYHSILKDSCNALVALVLSLYTGESGQSDKSSRPEVITKSFRKLLEQSYTSVKSPAALASQLHLSPAYLNECVKKTTGKPVSWHIQQRVILEAKRLLYHSDQSVKEIAALLGYDDYPYFSRLFTKVAGVTPLNFRRKNRD